MLVGIKRENEEKKKHEEREHVLAKVTQAVSLLEKKKARTHAIHYNNTNNLELVLALFCGECEMATYNKN